MRLRGVLYDDADDMIMIDFFAVYVCYVMYDAFLTTLTELGKMHR